MSKECLLSFLLAAFLPYSFLSVSLMIDPSCFGRRGSHRLIIYDRGQKEIEGGDYDARPFRRLCHILMSN